MKYYEQVEGEWISPVHRNYKLACCDCGLVHKVDFQVSFSKSGKPSVHYRVFRDEKATAAMRRPLKFSRDKD